MMPHTNLNVPTTETEVTTSWLSTALASDSPDSFTSLQSERIGEDFGFASHIYRFQWQDNSRPQSVVVKLWRTNTKTGINEIHFYKTFQNTGIRIPKCFYYAVDKEANKAVLILEDLSNADQGDVLASLSLERAKQVAHGLASLHAIWHNHPQLYELAWLPSVSTWSLDIDWVQSRRLLFLERFPDRLDGLARLLLNKLEVAPQIANGRLAHAPITLLHGDFHLDNFLFIAQTEPVLLDWSRPLKGPPAYNLVDLLFSMVTQEKFEQVFSFYLDKYSQIADTTLNKTTLEKQLGGALLRKFAIATCGIAKWQPKKPRALKMIDTSIEDTNRMIKFWHERDPELFSFL